jgi:hypothetical protein
MSAAKTQQRAGDRVGRASTIPLGGAEGNEILTSAIAIVLTVLLALEGVTVVDIAGLLSAHMFIGLVLLPPVTLKLASTGYRAFRYYTHSRAYRALGPPRLALRVLAPALVASTIAIFVSGVLLLALGHKAGTVLEIHKLAFIVFGLLFVPHLVAYAPGWFDRFDEIGVDCGASRCPAPI